MSVFFPNTLYVSHDQCHALYVLNTFEFLRIFGAAEKIQAKVFRAAEKSQGIAEKNNEFFGSQSVEMFCFARKTKINMWRTSS